MVRLTGVEPVTARFVAEYSIQLSYKRSVLLLKHFNYNIALIFHSRYMSKKWVNYEVLTLVCQPNL